MAEVTMNSDVLDAMIPNMSPYQVKQMANAMGIEISDKDAMALSQLSEDRASAALTLFEALNRVRDQGENGSRRGKGRRGVSLGEIIAVMGEKTDRALEAALAKAEALPDEPTASETLDVQATFFNATLVGNVAKQVADTAGRLIEKLPTKGQG